MMSALCAILLSVTPAMALRWNHANELLQGSQAADVYPFVDSSCKMTVNTKEKKLFLKSKSGNFVVVNGQVQTEAGTIIGKTTPKPLICESDTGPTERSEAFFVVADGAPYFNSCIDHFLNKHCWAKTNKVKYYLWFGQSTDEDFLKLFRERPTNAAKCSESPQLLANSPSHYLYPIGMRKILEDKNVTWLVSMDISDSWFNGKHFHTNLFKKFLTDYAADLVWAAQNGKSSAFVNGALWAIKNTGWSKGFLDDVFKNRCGSMNQHAYWNTILTHWKQEKPDLSWNENDMSKYRSAKKVMTLVGVPMLSPEQQKVYLTYRGDATLREPLHFGSHMTILPNAAATRAAPESFIGFRGNMDHSQEPFLCHAPPHSFNAPQKKGSSCYGPETMCKGGGKCQCD